jgi:murein DD-endopeptidase MepM/ murein hydrolase activator NlpD
VPHRPQHRRGGRHRAPLVISDRTRTVALTATLGAALVTGVAGGTTAAATSRHHDAPRAPSTTSAAISSPMPTTAGAAAEFGTDDIPDDWTPPAVPVTGLAADSVRQKARPLPVLQTVSTGAAWVNPNPTARVTSCFGRRWGRQHEGVDMAAPDGTPIVAAGAGVVVRAGVAEGYGNAVLIDHGNGFLTHYGHLSAITVTVGQHVAAGQQIGNEGSTGHSTGPHLHFEVHQGFYKNPIEPTQWMHDHGVDIPGCTTPAPAVP